MALETAEMNLGGFRLNFVWASNLNIRASNSNTKAYTNFNLPNATPKIAGVFYMAYFLY